MILHILLVISWLIEISDAGQMVIPPIYSPCDFPSPVYTPAPIFKQECLALPHIPFLCDLHHQLVHSSTVGIENTYEKYRPFLTHHGNSTLAIILVKQLEAPTSTDNVYNDLKYKCLFENECNLIDNEIVRGFVTSVKVFMKVYAWKLYERWFGLDEKCTQPNVLVLIVMDGLVNDARKIPYVRIHSGENRMKFVLSNIQSEATNALVQGWPLQTMIENLVDDVGYAVKEIHELNGEIRDHSVPRWARHVFLLCFILVVLALVIEWYIVRRKLGVQKSGSGIKITSVKSKTHLMF
ncbi:unnamed protein product [Auanema sp. JU1783]|nr:unnamed protein product [Auanema sp. JU1783]